MDKLLRIQKTISFLTKEERSGIYEYVLQNEVRIIKKETGMIMNSVSDSFNNPFYLGEVLVSAAEVEYKNFRGYGMSLGDKNEDAVILAAVEVFIDADKKELIEEIDKYLKEAYRRYEESLKKETVLTMGTKVNFGLMTEG
jgi:alpha-D-ribose 1-methylphosphonate 5-triphosphate synthase subunit PhnG